MRPLKGLFFILFFMLFLINIFSQETYNGKIIKEINFEGLANISQSDLDSVVKYYILKPYSNELFDDLQVKLYALDYFDGFIKPSFKLKDDKLTITFNVKEKPLIKSITFENNTAFWNSELLDKISINVYKPLNRSELNKSSIRIEDIYKSGGYLNASVSHDIKEDGTSIDVIFKIVSGPKYVIKEVNFEGNVSFKANTLRKAIISTTASLFNDGKYLELNIEKDKMGLESFYKDNGYINAKVTKNDLEIKDPPTESKKEEKEVYLKYYIAEGEVYKFGKITILGNVIFSTEELMDMISFKEGDIFNNSKFEQNFANIREKYFSDGYIFTEMIPEQRITGDSVDISIKIIEKDKAHIESITITGNKKTSPDVILREIPLIEGDVFSLAKFKLGMLNLQQLGYFGNVVPDIQPSSTTEGLMKINLDVEEKGTGNFVFGMNFGGSANTKFPFSVFGQWEEANFLGKGYSLSARLNLSFSEQSLSLTFRDNWFLQERWTLGAFSEFSHSVNTAYQDINGPIFAGKMEVPDPFSNIEEYRNAKNFTDFNIMNYSLIKLSLGGFTGYTFSNFLGKQTLLGTLQTTLKYVIYDNQVNRPSNYYLRDNYNAIRFENALLLSATWDTRNSATLSNDGFLLKQQFDFFGGFLFGQSHFIKSTTTFERYFSLLGYRDVFSPIFDIVVTLRSIYSNVLPPLGNGFEIEIQPQHQIIISENFMQARGWGTLQNIYSSFVNTIQISIPVVKNILVWDVLFLDIASYSLSNKNNSLFMPFNTFVLSWGMGIRSILPQLPLAFVIAQPFFINDDKLNLQHKYTGGFKFFLAIDIKF